MVKSYRPSKEEVYLKQNEALEYLLGGYIAAFGIKRLFEDFTKDELEELLSNIAPKTDEDDYTP